MAHYVAPIQGKLSQLFDVVVLMALTFGALYIPMFLGLAGGRQDRSRRCWPNMGSDGPERGANRAV